MFRNHFHFFSRSLCLLLLACITHVGIGAPNIPTSVIEQINPGRTGEDLAPKQDPPTGPEEDQVDIAPSVPIKVKNKTKVSFILKGINFTGDLLVNPDELLPIYADFLTKKININDIQQICIKLTRFYRNRGFIITRVIVPPQEIHEDGILTLQVVSGYVDTIKVEGILRDATYNLLLAYGKNICIQKPLTLKQLERFTLLANDIPGARVKAVLRPSTENPGAAELTFLATQQRNDWSAGVNNFSSEVLGRGQMFAAVNANGYLPGSQTSARGVLGFYISRLKYFALAHKQQINANGLGIDILLSNTITHPDLSSIALAGVQTPGQSFIFDANLKYTYTRSRTENLYFSIGFNYLNAHTAYFGVPLFKDGLRSIDLKFTYNKYLANGSMHEVEGAIYQGLHIFNAHTSPPSIPGGKLAFSKATLSLSRYQHLFKNRAFILIWARGQYAFNSLLSSETFGFGGSPFGYGFDPSTITGDRGYALKIEPQYNVAVKENYIKQIQYFAFLDNGGTWNINNTIQAGHQEATSMGVGARTTILKRLYAELILAKPFNTYVTNNSSNNWRILFNFSYNGGMIFG